MIPLKYIKIEHLPNSNGNDSLIKTVRISTSLVPNTSYTTTLTDLSEVSLILERAVTHLTHGSSAEELISKLDSTPETYTHDSVFGLNVEWDKKLTIKEIKDNPFRDGTKLSKEFDKLVIGKSPVEQVKEGKVSMPMIKKAFDKHQIILG